MLRIGYGFDVHQFGGCRPLIIGGVEIPYMKKIKAHSDGDVMMHASIDALLGAACHGDIGSMFPDTDPKYNNMDSRKLLRIAWNKITIQGYLLENIDITVILQIPTINTYIYQMRHHLSQDLNCAVDNINIKATTTDTLGYIGRSEGIACIAVVLLTR
ncbi:2-C-methyl-D-erythritol 2,4-cyclodiphosphate synthase [Blochmannia endosymbiont of Camponotus sp. C-003]|uniref:2-C-methyl-D-erythritol 2,4-cyclodiphosphate synthase n=1 Tax=unclassified Candidatus Blochmanniella TaxID=711328 RepID=UPI0020259FA5|nr:MULTISPECIES: 2-C-methyl-D-erythritol 2,4-cyclodiphosphate synthase [unclassified Candidatus Blochmannia]URJ23077.1 2-C-methyl-D-erythritol 2,4-cyclodiphosphate synthase [Blochmannia endosymbiont of Camponotus sp. C-003]URJ28544.1 2-C-methyl-D-erythritol 2,4-cyclodiphosphate synthase [Blochmannia endosymbiont of Camponotus sp. C-046]